MAHMISALLVQQVLGQIFLVTTVYGPSIDEHKLEFIEELRRLNNLVSVPWLLTGDFNLIRWLINISRKMRGFGLMCNFNDLISELALMEFPLQNRYFTWSSKRPSPTFSKIDMVFASSKWSTHFLKITLTAIEVIISYYSPLILTCQHLQPTRKPYRLEKFWLSFPQVEECIKHIWSSPESQRLLNFQQRT